MRFSLASPTTAAFLVVMASRLLRQSFRSLHGVHFRYGPHAALPSFQRGFLEVLQAIRRLLARPKYFRPEREWPGGYFTHETRAPLQGTHNNYVERQIKSYATGRKAWLFAYDAAGAQASANLYSLVMTCRANDIEPYAYLNYLFEHLPAASTVEQFEALLPWNVKAVLDEQNKKSLEKQSQQQSAA